MTTDKALLQAIDSEKARKLYDNNYRNTIKFRLRKGLSLGLDLKIKLLTELGYECEAINWTAPNAVKTNIEPLKIDF